MFRLLAPIAAHAKLCAFAGVAAGSLAFAPAAVHAFRGAPRDARGHTYAADCRPQQPGHFATQRDRSFRDAPARPVFDSHFTPTPRSHRAW